MRLGRRSPALLLALLLTGCATARVVPVPAAGVTVERQASAVTTPEGIQVVVQPSAWRGQPWYLPDYVTPFHLEIANGSAQALEYAYADLVLFDEARFQYTALPPEDVVQILRAIWGATGGGVRVAAAGGTSGPLHHRAVFWDPWWWDPWWWGPPAYPYGPYPPPPRVDDVLTQALPVGTLQPGARLQGYVYFPRLRREATRLAFELHYRLGGAPRVLAVPFAVQRAAGPPERVGRG